MSTVVSLLESLSNWEQQQPHKLLYSYLNDAGDILKSITYQQLHHQSSYLAHVLRSQYNCQVGDRVLLVYPPSLEFILAFFACLKAGVIAVPTFPPDPSRLNKDVTMFVTIAKSCNASLALTSASYNFATKLTTLKDLVTGQLNATGIEWPRQLTWVVTDSILSNSSMISAFIEESKEGDRDSSEDRNKYAPCSIAFLQYTSGSTSEPKGVVITQQSLAHNLKLIITGLSAVDDTIVVSWLPQYHDMGLIGSFLGVLYCGGSGYYLSPISFIRNPNLWIQCIGKYRGTHMQAPNFAYSLCARKFLVASRNAEAAWVRSLDLSCVRHMINAAEPVEASAIDAFYAVFERYGLRRGVIFPTYGLAEHTVYVCSNGQRRIKVSKRDLEASREVVVLEDNGTSTSRTSSRKSRPSKAPESDDTNEIWIVGCGRPVESDSLQLLIVDTTTQEALGSNRVGEIWLRSPSCADGYWGLPEKSAEDFGATISGSVDKYLRTGDLGFINEGELFICGRVKDLIIIRGRNHYPQDIERSCEAHAESALRLGCSAAFSVPMHGAEHLVYVAETNESLAASSQPSSPSPQLVSLAPALGQHVGALHGVAIDIVCFVKPRTIPKTTSGKIARQWVRKAFLEGTLQLLYQWNAMNEVQTNDLDDYFVDTSASQGPAALCPDQAHLDALALTQTDPTGQPLEQIMVEVQKAVASMVGKPYHSLDTNVPLSRLGMDSMRGIELQAAIEKLYSVPLPEALLFEADATIRTISQCLCSGGRIKSRPVMVNGWELIEAGIAQVSGRNAGKVAPPGALPQQWFREHAVKADVDTLKFPDGCARQLAPLSKLQEVRYILVSLWLFGMFFLMPIVGIAAFVLFPFKNVLTAIVVWLIGIYSWPADKWPPAFRRTTLSVTALRYFSSRLILEQPINTAVPAVYAMGPHGVFAIGHSIQVLVNEYLVGASFHHLAASATFLVPMYNITLKMMGYKSVDRNTFKKTLESGRSVGVVPGGIAEMFSAGRPDYDEVMVVLQRKGFVKIALETGSQLVPCYCFGNTQTFTSLSGNRLAALSRALRMSLIWFWGRFYLPVPYRTPLLTVIGRPIQCPKIENPSAEIVNEYHDLYLRETKRIFATYRNAYDWNDKKLVFTA